MAYDETLAVRIREALNQHLDVEEKAMFGGLCFMVGGHMAVGIVKNDLMVRVGPAAYEDALARKGVRPMDFTGQPLKGMVYVARAHLGRKRDLESWVAQATDFVATLPKRDPARRAAKRAARRAGKRIEERPRRSRLKLQR